MGTRFFEVMATGTTLLLANRINSLAYSSLGIHEGKHALFFETLPELEAIVHRRASRLEWRSVALGRLSCVKGPSWADRNLPFVAVHMHPLTQHSVRSNTAGASSRR